jgi:hypothetical protein
MTMNQGAADSPIIISVYPTLWMKIASHSTHNAKPSVQL